MRVYYFIIISFLFSGFACVKQVAQKSVNTDSDEELTYLKDTICTIREAVFDIVEENPVLKSSGGNMQVFLRDNLVYPPLAVENGIQGKVYVEFIIDTTGNVACAKIRKSVDRLLDNEALRVIRLSKWIPGKQRGISQYVRYIQPVSFKLS